MDTPIKALAAVEPDSDPINHDRRQHLAGAAMGLVAAAAASLFPVRPALAAAHDEIRPFRISVPEEDLVDLRRRLAATRWPEKETVDDDSTRSTRTTRHSISIGTDLRLRDFVKGRPPWGSRFS